MSMDAQMYLTKRFNAMPPDMVWDMLPPSLRVGVEDKYEVCSKYYREVLL